MIWLIGHVLAVCIGVSLGLIGGGGSILAAPVLIYVMGIAPKSAFAMTLAIVGAVSAIGIIPHWRQGNINLKIAMLFAPPAMVGAYAGARIAGLPLVTPTVQLLAFAAIMLIASFSMITKGKGSASLEAHSYSEEGLEVSGVKNSQIAIREAFAQRLHRRIPTGIAPAKHGSWAIILEGFGVGLLTGFVGIGGGFLVIPTLVILGGIPMKEAIGTSLIILVLKSITGLAGYLGHVPLEWGLVGSFIVAASAGILLGAYLMRFVCAKQLEKGFGYFVLAVAIFILIER
ncbi:MAG: sulfite exporter TauE/SafE family protein [Desertifilum sp.]|nr:sulfite exporter TauE/SafE family protein [Desertifilum sp.]